MPDARLRAELLDQLVELALNVIGSVGLALILYGVVAEETQDAWAPLEAIADWVAMGVTLVAVAATALSVLLPPVRRPPEVRSTHVTLWVVLAMVLSAAGYAVAKGQPLPQHATLGFAILGLAGHLLRTVSYGRHTTGHVG